MRFINRKQKTVHIENYNLNKPTTSSEAQKKWKKFQGYRSHLQGLILAEQNNLCAYTEIDAGSYGFGYHLEHIKPKSKYPSETFNYKNIVVSALNSGDLSNPNINKKNSFGGHYKGDDYDSALFISCTDNDCERYFAYLNDGYIVPQPNLNEFDTDKATYTIKLLNLNSPLLVHKRKRVLEKINSLIDNNFDDIDYIRQLKSYYMTPNNDAYPESFITAISQAF